MLSLTGKCYVTNLKQVSPKLLTGSVYTFEKVGEEFKTTFVKAKFVGKALQTLAKNKTQNKDLIFILESGLNTNTFKNKDGVEVSELNLTIFDLDYLDKEANKKENEAKFGPPATQNSDLPW